MVTVLGTVGLVGLDARPVRVEAVLAGGIPGVHVVGLPDTAVRESQHRVSAAVKRSGFSWVRSRLVVNLAPASFPKAGTGFDLPVALALLAATEQIPEASLEGIHAVGELGLDGTVRPVRGILPAAAAVRSEGGRLLVAERGAVEAALVEGLDVVAVRSLKEAAAVLCGDRCPREIPEPAATAATPPPDLLDVRGQHVARRALEIAAAGGHHLLLVGPPGCGKSMLARRLPSLLPPLDDGAALEVAAVHSIAGIREPDDPLRRTPPFRAPHPGTSVAGLVGGGSGVARPGALSLAHHGVLFLDEMLEMPRAVLDALRQPLEDGRIVIPRSRAVVSYPARVMLTAATNPCPCGHLGSRTKPCRCRPHQIQRYRARLSGPLLDRIDVHVEMPPVERAALLGPPDGEDSETVAARVDAARGGAAGRWGAGRLVRDAATDELREVTAPPALRAAATAVETLGLSARAFDRCLRVARTIADLEGSPETGTDHVEEAVAYRLAPALAST